MTVKVSVVVPVYNPGEHIEPLLASLRRQSMPAADFEVVFVDDGSTDETPARLDKLAAEQPNVTVVHTPNSGWPSRPRNIGVDTAVGDYVWFVDNDDEIGDEALERLHDYAVAHDADVAVGKEVRRPGRWAQWALFDVNRPDATLADGPLLSPLTPHKMFRRAFLDRHGIRFPEGRRRAEDAPFVMRAYFLANRIAVLSDYPCYVWTKRPGHAGARPTDWGGWFAALTDVLDVVEEHTVPGEFRSRLLGRWYRGKCLAMAGKVLPKVGEEQARSFFDAAQAFVADRLPPSVEGAAPNSMTLRSALFRSGDLPGLRALTTWEAGLRVEQETTDLRADADGFTLTGTMRLVDAEGAPVRVRSDRADRRLWVPPAELAEVTARLPAHLLEVTSALDNAVTDLVVVDRRSHDAVRASGSCRAIPPASEEGPLAFAFEVALRPDETNAGTPLRAGVYDLYQLLTLGGLAHRTRLRAPAGSRLRAGLPSVWWGRHACTAYTTHAGRLQLEVGQHRVTGLDLVAPQPSGCRLERGPDTVSLVLPLHDLVVARRLHGRLVLRPEPSNAGSAGAPTYRLPFTLGPGQTSIRAPLPLDHPGFAAGRWRVVVRLGPRRRRDIGLLVEPGRIRVRLLDGNDPAARIDAALRPTGVPTILAAARRLLSP
ncbi:MAG TPA: glycosyltransferase [Nocardioidaceae bacterium]|nr:glycosyltransferase [Nocardioidaceae bacterium]